MAALIPVSALGVNVVLSQFSLQRRTYRISPKSVEHTVLRSSVIFFFSHRFSIFFTPRSVALLVFFA